MNTLFEISNDAAQQIDALPTPPFEAQPEVLAEQAVELLDAAQ